MGRVLAAHGRAQRLVPLYQRQLETIRQLRMDIRVGRAVGMGLLSLRAMGKSQRRMRLGLGSRNCLGSFLGIMASGEKRFLLVHWLGPVAAGSPMSGWCRHQFLG